MKPETLYKLIAWETGNMEDDMETVVELFQELIDSGDVWLMPGYYPRMARMLIERGHCRRAVLEVVK